MTEPKTAAAHNANFTGSIQMSVGTISNPASVAAAREFVSSFRIGNPDISLSDAQWTKLTDAIARQFGRA